MQLTTTARPVRALILLMAVAVSVGILGAPAARAEVTGTTIIVNITDDIVDSTNGTCSLREAITAANTNAANGSQPGACSAGSAAAPDVIILPEGTLCCSLTIEGKGENANATGDLDITGDVIIKGRGSGVTTLNINRRDRVFDIKQGVAVTIQDLRIWKGQPGAGADGAAGQNGGKGADGGGTYNAGVLTLKNVVLDSNEAGAGGRGGASTGGGPAGRGGDGGRGGAIFNTDSGVVHLEDSKLIFNNSGPGGAGGAGAPGVASGDGGDGGHGGGIYNQNDVTMLRTRIDASTARAGGAAGGSGNPAGSAGLRGNGGGLHNEGTFFDPGDATITQSVIIGNQAANGGGLHNDFWANLTVIDSSVELNSFDVVPVDGGGIYNATSANLTVKGSTIYGNQAQDDGGGILNFGNAKIENSTFHLNSAADQGGGFYTGNGSPAALRFVSLVSNSAPEGANVFSAGLDSLTIMGSLLEGSPSCSSRITDGGYNLVTPSSDGTCPATFLAGDAATAGLADNGGPTRTIAVGAGGAAVDRIPANVGCPTTDQRGSPRPAGIRCDIGAFEVQGSALKATSLKLGPMPTDAVYSDDSIFTATLEDWSVQPPVPISGRTITFSLGTGTGTATTDGNGVASKLFAPQAVPTDTISVSFAGDSVYGPSQDSGQFPVAKESCALEYFGDTTGSSSSPVSLAGRFRETGNEPGFGLGPSGKTIVFTLTNQANQAQTFTATTTLFGEVQKSVTLAEGTYAVRMDFAGDGLYLPCTPGTGNLVVTSPTLTSIAVTPANPTVEAPTTVQFTATGTYSDGSTKTLTGVLWGSTNPFVATISSSGLASVTGEGQSTISAKVGDVTGTTVLTATKAPQPNSPPTISPIPNKTVAELSTLTFTVSASDPDGDTLTYSIFGGASGMTINPSTGVFSWTPTEAQGGNTYTVFVRATDPSGAFAETAFQITVTQVNSAPTISPVADKAVAWGQVLSFGVTASDPDGDALSFSLVSPPAGASIDASSGGFSWTPSSSQIGAHQVTVRVTDDGAPAMSAEATFAVVVGKRPTVMSYSGKTSGQYSDPVVLKATLIDAFEATVIGGKQVTFTIGSQSGSDVTDGVGSAEVSVTLGQAAGSYEVVSSFAGDGLYEASEDADPFTITKETMSLEYTGQSLVSTAAAGGTASLEMAARVVEEADGSPGAIAWSQIPLRVRFDLMPGGSSSTIPVASCTATVDQADGTALCTAAPALKADAYVIQLSLVANDYFAAEVENAGAAITEPGPGSIAGAGTVADPKGGLGSFAFRARFNGGALLGSSVYMFPATADLSAAGAPAGMREYNFIIRSNALDGLLITCPDGGPCTGRLTGKSTVRAVDRESGVNFTLGAGLIGKQQFFQVDVTDNTAQPGSPPDSYAVKVWTSKGTYHAAGTATEQLPLGDGKIEVVGGEAKAVR